MSMKMGAVPIISIISDLFDLFVIVFLDIFTKDF